MDPWLEHQLHLAEARGSLVAPNSRVQDRALEYLLMMAERRRQMARVDALKMATSTSSANVDRVKAYFPEYFPEETAFETAKRKDGSYDIDRVDDSRVEWTTPRSPDEDADISAWINQRERGSATAADLDNGWK